MSGPWARIEIEPIAILKDVCGLDSVQTLEVLEWVGKLDRGKQDELLHYGHPANAEIEALAQAGIRDN